MNYMQKSEYLNLLQNWLPAAEREFYSPADRPDLLVYGLGYSANWGIQTNLKAAAAFAVAGKALDDEEVLDRAVRMVRFSLASHLEGDYHGTDNDNWGHTWITVLGLERFMHALDPVFERFNNKDRANLQQVLVSEADWLLHHYEIVAGLENDGGRNKPESNLWNGAHLYRTAMVYPDSPNHDAYLTKARKFFLNGISLPADLVGNEDGLVEGANFFESLSLDHHGYLNVGYMVICLSQLAMLYFWLREKNHPIPPELLIHARELWILVKSLTFEDGRLWRIGGDTRARYCYCQDYMIPVFQLARALWHDDVDTLEREWCSLVKKEQEYNEDGGFLSQRGSKLRTLSPLYYTRLDSDRACSLSMGYHWFDLSRGSEKTKPIETLTTWSEPFHGAAMIREEKRRASFVWRAGEGPTALFHSSQDSSMAEWYHNLTPSARGQGNLITSKIHWQEVREFDGGFATAGCYDIREDIFIAESDPPRPLLRVHLLYAVLPDGETAVIMQHAYCPIRNNLWEMKSLFMQIPNDLFNDNRRVWHWLEQDHVLTGPPEEAEVIETGSDILTLKDGKGSTQLSLKVLYGGDSLKIIRPTERQIGFKKYPDRAHAHKQGMLFCDEICLDHRVDRNYLNPGEIMIDCAVALSLTDKTPELIEHCQTDDSRILTVKDNRGQSFRLVLSLTSGTGRWECKKIRYNRSFP
jgi:hypothetical protein